MVVRREQIEVEVPLPYLLHSSDVCRLSADLLKYILVQQNQIPKRYDLLIQDRNRFSDKHSAGAVREPPPLAETTNIRIILREQKEYRKKKRLEEKYLKKVSHFLDECEEMLAGLTTTIEEELRDIVSIRFNIGATPVSPKISYILLLPEKFAATPNPASRPGSLLFRSLVTDENIFRLSCERTPVKSLFLSIEKKSVKLTETVFVPTCVPESKRGVQIYIKLFYQLREPEKILSTQEKQEQDFKKPETAETRKRVDSGNYQTPVGRKDIRGRTGQASLTPDSMDMCTPYENGIRDLSSIQHSPGNIHSRKRYFSNEFGTPVSTSMYTYTKRNFGSMELCTGSMELCTPAGKTLSTCTPGTNRRISGMELCTPFTSCTKRLSNMDLCTGTNRRISGMELCTPNIGNYKRPLSTEPCTPYTSCTKLSNMDLCTPYVDTYRRTSTCMELCSPFAEIKSVNHDPCTPYTENRFTSMDLCTPCTNTQGLSNIRLSMKDIARKSVRFHLASPEHNTDHDLQDDHDGQNDHGQDDHEKGYEYDRIDYSVNHTNVVDSMNKDLIEEVLTTFQKVNMCSETRSEAASDKEGAALDTEACIEEAAFNTDTCKLVFSDKEEAAFDTETCIEGAAFDAETCKVYYEKDVLVKEAVEVEKSAVNLEPAEASILIETNLTYWVTWPRPVKGFSDLPI